MILAKSPLRLSLGGGGTDDRAYVRENGGQCITAAIDRYVYALVKSTYAGNFWVKYSEVEYTDTIDQIAHPIFREVMRFYNVPRGTEIVSLADVPSGTGLGSSGAFTVTLCHAISTYLGLHLDQDVLARHAAEIELDILGSGGGVQDHYACALGGLQVLTFHENGLVDHHPLILDETMLQMLQDRLCLYFTGVSREANAILKTQTADGLNEIKTHGETSLKMLESGDFDGFAYLMNDHWQAKQRRSPFMSNETIDGHYQYALSNGALGGKLVGAGGGGFLLFVAQDVARLDAAMTTRNLQRVPFRFDMQGTTVTTI